jgi:hypothetical protein
LKDFTHHFIAFKIFFHHLQVTFPEPHQVHFLL